MKKHMQEKESDELKQLLKEVRSRMQQLKEYGVSEQEILSSLHPTQPMQQLIVNRNYRLFLGDECKEIHLEPLVKAVYLLFLKHPEGINFKDLPDYREELTRLYDKIRPWGLTDRALQSIEDVTNPMLNSINEKCARIRKAFVTVLDSSVVEYYYIKGARGQTKRIALPPELILWE